CRDLGVAPHPPRKALEAAQRRFGGVVSCRALYVAARAQGRWPVGLDRDGIEAFVDDQPTAELGAHAIELLGSVGRLAHPHQARMTDLRDQAVEVAQVCESLRMATDFV